jgi:hypothetical protein
VVLLLGKSPTAHAFGVGSSDIYQGTARQNLQLLAVPVQLSSGGPNPNMCWLHQTASNSASTGPSPPTVPSGPVASTTTGLASVMTPLMVPAATAAPDPHCIVTSLIPDLVEELLRIYDIHNDWEYILVGLHNGFDIGIREPPPRMYIFCKSHFLEIGPSVYFRLHPRRAAGWPLFHWLLPR